MRNIAKGGCQTKFTFVPDIDMIPNQGLDLSLDEFLTIEGKNCDKCAFVIPVYEISNDVTHLPKDKTELLNYVNANLSRQFHMVILVLAYKLLLPPDKTSHFKNTFIKVFFLSYYCHERL